MHWLIAVSFLWAFSFGLVKTRLPELDSTALAVARNLLAFIFFLPFFRLRQVGLGRGIVLFFIGAVQFGLMYAFYMAAFAYLRASEIALFTIFTPLYVALVDSVLEFRFTKHWFIAAGLAILGAGIIHWQRADFAELWRGFLLMQASNFCFAFGQIAYKRFHARLQEGIAERRYFAWLMAGGFVATLACAFWQGTDWGAFRPSMEQWGVLLYLGIIASGAGFFLWNRGATLVNAGTLAVFNNLKIPLGVACSLFFFGESFSYEGMIRLGAGFLLVFFAVCIAQKNRLNA
ncbi:MAG: EamA family transporter [Puniceicoccales bacterium]|nr:EamA family transporter [Puniceicoccales bacterium]